MVLSRCKGGNVYILLILILIFFADGVNCWISRILYMFDHVLRQGLFLAPPTQNKTSHGDFQGILALYFVVLGECLPGKATHESLVNLFSVVVIHDNPPFSEGDIITLEKRRVVMCHDHTIVLLMIQCQEGIPCRHFPKDT